MKNNVILEVKNVTKKYEKFTLDDFSFCIPEGKIVGFIGRNGAGKTTTLKGIMNLIHFDSGEVFFMGKSMKENEFEAKQKIGFTLSELNYYPLKKIKSILDVVKRFYSEFSTDKFYKFCELFNLDVNKKLSELSSGMKVKYSLALALSHNAKLLIFDEPTSGLDPISRDEILDIFKKLVKNNNVSILFSTHITSDLDKCADEILYIKGGKRMFNGEKSLFIDSYRYIEGPIALLDKIKTDLISFKDEGKSFNGLIEKDKLAILENYKEIDIKEPDLEEIMVYLERGKDHEEFIL